MEVRVLSSAFEKLCQLSRVGGNGHTDSVDHATHDESGDVLYLHVGEPRAAAESEETPEGHVLRFDPNGRIIGLTIINARWLLDRDGELAVTLPEQVHLDQAAIAPLLAAA